MTTVLVGGKGLGSRPDRTLPQERPVTH
jgi:hypothetical protein